MIRLSYNPTLSRLLTDNEGKTVDTKELRITDVYYKTWLTVYPELKREGLGKTEEIHKLALKRKIKLGKLNRVDISLLTEATGKHQGSGNSLVVNERQKRNTEMQEIFQSQ